ncbi:Uncharacterised protein [Vibrio cholerae]|nr:Uncharacterised protein [Vibrio cholerae]CSI44476.1 Uncharacterised protein [Vibrio cholerae]
MSQIQNRDFQTQQRFIDLIDNEDNHPNTDPDKYYPSCDRIRYGDIDIR